MQVENNNNGGSLKYSNHNDGPQPPRASTLHYYYGISPNHTPTSPTGFYAQLAKRRLRLLFFNDKATKDDAFTAACSANSQCGNRAMWPWVPGW
jgi:hypothetical protein